MTSVHILARNGGRRRLRRDPQSRAALSRRRHRPAVDGRRAGAQERPAAAERRPDRAVSVHLAQRVAELRRAGHAERVIGLGMDSTERGVDPRDFAEAFRLGGSVGLRLTSHAGEDTGPGNIATALDALGIERIDHGLAILEDEALTRRVAEERIPLTVCPNSNIIIANKYKRLEEHPFRRMRK